MIKLNGKVVDYRHFPDNSLCILNLENSDFYNPYITWYYENDEEMVLLYYLVSHIRNVYSDYFPQITLIMPYIPNARMDRTKSEKEVFTLKYFTQFINSLNFIEVWVFDPHSYVSEALINNIRFFSVENIIKYIIVFEYNNDIDLVYFPDAGAMKRYSQYFTNQNINMIYGNKVRNWETGKIEGLEILNKDGKPCEKSVVDGKKILMIDDIISYGGTMAYSADKLHEMGAKQIDIYASHLENSFFDKEKGTLRKRMEFGTNIVNCIYTTNSIYKEENNIENFNIRIINNFKIK